MGNMPKIKIGCGVITTGERNLPDYLLPDNAVLFVYTDSERKGPAYARNRVLKELYDAGCDYIFLMDDDVIPRREDWFMIAIEKSFSRNLDFIGWPHVFDQDPISYSQGSLVCAGVTVQFALVTRKCVEVVGYFDERYGKYGPEDISYAYRAHLAGFTGEDKAGFEVPLKVLAGIHVEDMFSCFRNSVVSDVVKVEGMKAGQYLLDELVANAGPVYVPFKNE